VRYLAHHGGVYAPPPDSPHGRRPGRKSSLDEENIAESINLVEDFVYDNDDDIDSFSGSVERDEEEWVNEASQRVDEMFTAQMDSSIEEAFHRRRNHTVRAMVRYHVLRYPLLLSTSVERIEERLGNLMSDPDLMKAFRWVDFVRVLRRTESQHSNWKKKVWSIDLPSKPATLEVSRKPVYLKEPKVRSGMLPTGPGAAFVDSILSSSDSSDLVVLIDDVMSASDNIASKESSSVLPTHIGLDMDVLSIWRNRIRSVKVANKINNNEKTVPTTTTTTTTTASIPTIDDETVSNTSKSPKKLSIKLRKKSQT